MDRREGKISLVCHPDGFVRRVLRDELSSLFPLQPGSPLSLLVLPEDIARMRRFLRAVATRGGAFGRELNVLMHGGPTVLCFAGVRLSDDTLLVVGASGATPLLSLLDDYFLPAPVRAAAEEEPTLAVHEAFDELTRVNSELVNLQRELAKRNAALESITKQRNELLAAAAHDLRTPLTVVKGYCQLLIAQLGGERATMIRRVGDAAEYALDILTHALEYARLEAQAAPIALDETDLMQLAASVVELHGPLALAKDIRVVTKHECGMPKVPLDRVKIQQAIANLLGNAIKYSPPGSEVELAVGRSDGHAWVRITDHGVGIAQAELPLLFRPFQRTSSRPTAGETSTGLGLAIARRLVQAHGGTIDVRSELAQGTEFSIHIPLEHTLQAAASLPSEPAASAHQLGGRLW